MNNEIKVSFTVDASINGFVMASAELQARLKALLTQVISNQNIQLSQDGVGIRVTAVVEK